jgi:fatty acid desaturase
MRCGIVLHDACHASIFRSNALNQVIRLLFGNVAIGISAGWWRWEHNAHHARPNVLGVDPDIAVPHLVFCEEQRASRGPILRAIARIQAPLFIPLWSIQSIYLRVGSLLFLLERRARRNGLEALLVLLHFAIYAAVVHFALSGWEAVAFVAVHQATFGLCAGSIFAPGHKGMPMLATDESLDYLHAQVATTRNIRTGRIGELWYGGLNYQVEHHLFPAVTRSHYPRVRVLVQDYCRKVGLPLHDCTPFETYAEILRHLARAGAGKDGRNE